MEFNISGWFEDRLKFEVFDCEKDDIALIGVGLAIIIMALVLCPINAIELIKSANLDGKAEIVMVLSWQLVLLPVALITICLFLFHRYGLVGLNFSITMAFVYIGCTLAVIGGCMGGVILLGIIVNLLSGFLMGVL